jgi:hypothetical protein
MKFKRILKRLDLASWLVSVNKMEKPTHKVGFVWPTSEPDRKNLINAMKANYGGIFEIINSICGEQNSIEPYGIASVEDFGISFRTVARLFAYDNKHYYVYKAISNPNKLGYLSRKQYYKGLLLQKNARKQGKIFDAKEYLKTTGTMASPFKLLKQAFKENREATKFLSAWFPLQEDGKLKHEDTLIMITNQLLRINLSEYKFVETPIDECYDLDFGYSSFEASGPRHNSSSCMRHHKVGGFYNNLPVIGYMVKKNGENIGRFLYWTLPDGKHYVDRLYVVKGDYAADVLNKIDKDFANDYKYHVTDVSVLSQYVIPFKSYENMKPGSPFPWIDTFSYLLKKGNDYYLSIRDQNGYTTVDIMHDTSNANFSKGFSETTCCHKRYWKTESNIYGGNNHKLYCEKYTPRAKKDRELLALFRKLKGVQYV